MIKIGIKTLYKAFISPSAIKFAGSKEAKELFYENLELFADPYWENLSFEDFEAMLKGMGLENVSNGKYHSINLERFIELLKRTEKIEDFEEKEEDFEQINNFNVLKKYIDKQEEVQEEDFTVKKLMKVLEVLPDNFKIANICE